MKYFTSLQLWASRCSAPAQIVHCLMLSDAGWPDAVLWSNFASLIDDDESTMQIHAYYLHGDDCLHSNPPPPHPPI